jgi:hypothetical protein
VYQHFETISMQTTTKPKRLQNDTSPALRTLVFIDLGNGLVKALIKPPGAKKFEQISFPSYVAEAPEPASDCLTICTGQGFKTYLVGERAAEIPMSHTGKDEEGKANNAKALLIHALRLAFGCDYTAIHCDVVFTSPSNKAYGSEISAQLQGVHPVTVPADAGVIGSEAQGFTVVVHRAIPQLEGHYAFKALGLKSDAWLIDVGNRTIIVSKLAATGRILQRRYFGGVGVRGLAERISARESLSDRIKEHSPERVIAYLFTAPEGVGDAIAADVSTCLAETLGFIGDDGAPRYVIGGGALLPGVAQALNATPAKNAQWANITALASMADEILGAK